MAIGGINATNAAGTIGAGAQGLSVVSAIIGASDPKAAAGELAEIVVAARRRAKKRA